LKTFLKISSNTKYYKEDIGPQSSKKSETTFFSQRASNCSPQLPSSDFLITVAKRKEDNIQ